MYQNTNNKGDRRSCDIGVENKNLRVSLIKNLERNRR